MSEFNVVDSSGWLEYLVDTERGQFFAPAIEDTAHLIVPIITVYEVFKRFLRERGETDALAAVGTMSSGRIIDIDPALALAAARQPLPLADSFIYATALLYEATLWTQDQHFKGLPFVRYFPKLPTIN